MIQSLRHSSTLTIERASAIDELRAWEIVEQYDDKEFSFVDALSFAVMERLGIVHAFALDRHFVQYGWVVLQIDET